MEKPDLKLLLDNSLHNYEVIKQLLLSNKDKNPEFPAPNADSIKEAYIAAYGNADLPESAWGQLSNLFEVEAGKAKQRKYKDRTYSDIIYFPRKKSIIPSRADIIKFQLSGGDPTLFEALGKESEDNLIAGAANLEEDVINSIESFFENYDSKSSLMRSKVEAVNRWKNINSYDEFLQIPLLKEGKDFMNKFLDIEETIAAGGSVPVEDLEDLIPDYMIDGLKAGEGLSLLDAVDPRYKAQSYIISEGISDTAKDLINRAFLASFSVVRISTLADLKNILNRINLLVKQITKKSETLIEGGEKKKHIQ